MMRALFFRAVPLLLAFAGASLIFAATPFHQAQAQLSSEERERLQAEYDQLQEEIVQWQKVLNEAKAKKNTIQGDVSALNAQIKKAEAEIGQRNNVVARLAGEINEKQEHISELEDRLEQGRASLAKLMREKNYNEGRSLAVLMLSAGDFFDFFVDTEAITSVNRELQVRFNELRGVRTETEQEKEELDERRNEEIDARYEAELKKQEVARAEAEQKKLLVIATQEEASYQQVLAERQQRAAEIYARLFPLRDTATIQFGDAVAYAKTAASKTGVRPALILAILSQESAIGTNVGNCLVTDLSTGDGKGKNTGTPFSGVMKAPRDTVPFERITTALGKDWRATPVSCPQSAGYGGAMGPTQFIPSTWELFEPRLKVALGVPATNPWNAGHAIMATGLYLLDGGAAAQTFTAERNAACRYFSGSACPGGGWIDGYANSVIAKANQYQQDIEDLDDL